MRKRFIVILSIQTVLILLLLTYAFIQKLEADKNFKEAYRQERIATEAMKKAEEARVRSEQLLDELIMLKEQLKK